MKPTAPSATVDGAVGFSFYKRKIERLRYQKKMKMQMTVEEYG